MESPEWRRIEELEELIASTPAATLDGARVQLALLVTFADGDDHLDSVAVRNVAATLGRPAPSAA
jgi:hypothetical protein